MTLYTHFFDPEAKVQKPLPKKLSHRVGDRTKRAVYVYEPEIVLAVNVALVTGRPLLVSGDPGTGKTSLAAHTAKVLSRRFYKLAISHRTHARDLLFSFDTVGRLSDAQTREKQKGAKARIAYVEPGVLWWAFNRDSAEWRGLTEERCKELGVSKARDPAEGERSAEQAVVLLDEIDKADPDVPNNLLEALGSYRFSLASIDEVREPIEAVAPPLIMLTTNDERELPRAFLRRCVSLTLKSPKKDRLLDIARVHYLGERNKLPEKEKQLHEEVAEQLGAVRRENKAQGRPRPSTAEYLDAIAACRELGVLPGTGAWKKHWDEIAEATLRKERKLDGGAA